MTTKPPNDETKEQDYETTPVQQYAPDSDRSQFFKQFVPTWFIQLPKLTMPAQPDPNFQLVSDEVLENLAQSNKFGEAEINRIKADRQFMEGELMRYFRELDSSAKLQQNNYRLFQISILVLATFATLIGSLQAISVDSPGQLKFFGIAEALVALITVFIIEIRGREATLPGWLAARRKAEQLRREYFRFLLRLPPYHGVTEDYNLKLLLSKRAADIYNDNYPEEPSILESNSA